MLRCTLLSGILSFWSSLPVMCSSLPSRQEVLQQVYPNASYQAERVFLTGKQLKDAAALAETEIASSLLARYIVREGGEMVGRAYIDTHVVRTKKESVLVCLDRAGRIKRIEVTAFLEPPEYRAAERWIEQFSGRHLDEDLRLQRAIRPLAGATLTAASLEKAVRRVLAIDAVLEKSRKVGP